MKTQNPPLTYNPFGKLKHLLAENTREMTHPVAREDSTSPIVGVPDHTRDDEIFRLAMQDVTPLLRDPPEERVYTDTRKKKGKYHSDSEALLELENLVSRGEGFVLSLTQEYMEGTGEDVPREIARRLHRGDYSIQAYIDLHGLSVEAARSDLNQFLTSAINSGKRAVLVIHGRGLSSPGEPILKNHVRRWITTGHWRKWVMAFTSAQSYDGGTGATYILLRNRPLSKRRQK